MKQKWDVKVDAGDYEQWIVVEMGFGGLTAEEVESYLLKRGVVVYEVIEHEDEL